VKALRVLILVVASIIVETGFAENVRFKQFGTHIPARPDLDVRWNPPADALPSQIWVYHLLPTKFSPKVVANLMSLSSLTEKDRTESSTNGMLFKSPDQSRTLRISFPSGSIQYEVSTPYNPTNLTKDVPNKKEALERVRKLLPKFGIGLSEIEKNDDGTDARLNCGDSESIFSLNGCAVTNVEWRGVGFRRAVDGITFISVGTGGEGHVRFGNHGKITKIDLSWRNMERVKSYPTLSPAEMIYALRQGKAVQGYLSMNSRGIDWRTAKAMTVNHLWARYYAGDSEHPSDMLEPFAVLDSDVDTGNGIVNVEIDCPIIDETAP